MSDDAAPPIDRAKVRAHIRHFDGDGLRILLHRAVELLPDEAFPTLIADYIGLQDITSDGTPAPGLIDEIRTFYDESLSGHFYEDFVVNWRNSLRRPKGTDIFIAEVERLVAACLRAADDGQNETVAEGLGLIVDLMRKIDACRDDIVFFADEAGSWQVGVLWDRVLPVWFRSLAPQMDADAWAGTVVDALNDFVYSGARAIVDAVGSAAPPGHVEALEQRWDDVLSRDQ